MSRSQDDERRKNSTKNIIRKIMHWRSTLRSSDREATHLALTLRVLKSSDRESSDHQIRH